MTEWYRNKSWSKKEEDYFFEKLGRARKDGRAQYLKIQAIELVETQNEKLLEVAELLLNKLFSEYSDDKFNKPSSLVALGDIYRIRNNYDKAIDYYKQAIDFETIYPQVQTQAYLNFSELVVKYNKTDFYEIAENVLIKKMPNVLFPIEKYKGYSILSIINNHKHNTEQAKHFAALAEENESKETSGLRYHKHLGIVKERDSWLDKLLRR